MELGLGEDVAKLGRRLSILWETSDVWTIPRIRLFIEGEGTFLATIAQPQYRARCSLRSSRSDGATTGERRKSDIDENLVLHRTPMILDQDDRSRARHGDCFMPCTYDDMSASPNMHLFGSGRTYHSMWSLDRRPRRHCRFTFLRRNTHHLCR